MPQGLNLYCLRQGDVDAPKFVILHGLFGSTPNFTSLAKALANSFDVMRIDLRNHGRSPHSDIMSYKTMADDVATTLAAQGVRRAIVLGHSMGGKVAMQLAADYPEMLTKLIVADIAPKQYAANSHDVVLQAMSAVPLAEINDRKTADQHMATILDDPMLRQFLLSNLSKADSGYEWRVNLSAIIERYQDIAAAPSIEQPCSIPSLFVRGGSSDYIRDSDFELIKRLFINAQLREVANAGHWLHAEQPQAFLTEVNEFASA